MINKLIKKLIQIDIKKRITWEEYFNDEFFKRKVKKEYYDNGKLKFEGEYLNGKKWNGKGFNINNEKVYEIKNGNELVKEYNNEGKIIFVGEYLNGERNGKGKNILIMIIN